MKSKKHILLLTPGYPQSVNDTTCIPPLQCLMSEMEQKYGQQLAMSVVAFQYPFKEGNFWWKDFDCHSAGGKNRKFPFKFLTWLRVIKAVKNLNRQRPIDAIHSFWLYDCPLIGQYFAKKYNIPHFVHVMGQDILPGNRYIKFLKTQNMHVIANSEFSAKVLHDNYGIKANSVIHFGLQSFDFSFIKPKNRSYDLIAVGSLTKLKNQDLFVEIFYELKQEFPFLTGRIIGDGPEGFALLKKIEALGLMDCLRLHGKVTRIFALYRMFESKIMVHTSGFESAGYVFLEALACGLKVVSFKTGFLPETPSTFPCDTKEQMLSTLRKLLSRQMEFHEQPIVSVEESAAKLANLYLQPRS